MKLRKFFRAVFVIIVFLSPVIPQREPAVNAAPANICHFGIGVAQPIAGYDLSSLGVGAYIDWYYKPNPEAPDYLVHLNVLQVDDASYSNLPASMPARVSNDRGAIWIIGNEPDSEVTYQDHISAESYGNRYYELAAIIRANDPTARIGFGPIIQPTPVRISYLQKALNRMVQLAGGNRAKALGLIDLYTIHAFILNEEPLYDSSGKTINWGAGLPVGYEASWGAPEVIKIRDGVNESYKTHSIEIFRQRILNFRQWMKSQGEQQKPLWITEYGSLFPSNGSSYLYVSEADTIAFMEQSFDFTLRYKDASLGYAGDENRLVQHLLWYSLNEYPWRFGGSLFDPTTRKMTAVGSRFTGYNPPVDIVPPGPVDVYIPNQTPGVVVGGKGSQPGAYNFRIQVRASNAISSDRLTGVKVDLYEGSRFLGSQQGNLPRCSGEGVFSFIDYNLRPGDVHTYRAVVTLLANNGNETNPGNQNVTLAPVTIPDVLSFYLPVIQK